MEHWKFTGDEDKARECIKRAQRELDIHRDLVRLGNLSQYRTQRVFGDGLTVECRTVFTDEIVNVYYNPGGGIKIRITERDMPVPLLVYSEDTYLRVFSACKSLMQKMPYEYLEELYIPSEYKPIICYFNEVKVSTLRSITSIDWGIRGKLGYDRLTFYDYRNGNAGNAVSEFSAGSDFVIASAVVVNCEGHEDFSSWGVIYAHSDIEIPSEESTAEDVEIAVKMALYDSVSGFREYHLETVVMPSYMTLADISGFASIFIYDYFGTPYFVASYIGITGWYIG